MLLISPRCRIFPLPSAPLNVFFRLIRFLIKNIRSPYLYHLFSFLGSEVASNTAGVGPIAAAKAAAAAAAASLVASRLAGAQPKPPLIPQGPVVPLMSLDRPSEGRFSIDGSHSLSSSEVWASCSLCPYWVDPAPPPIPRYI